MKHELSRNCPCDPIVIPLTPDRIVNQELLIQTVTDQMCVLMEQRGITKADLARRLGTTRGFVTQILSGERNMELKTIADVFRAMGYRLETRPVMFVGSRAESQKNRRVRP